MSKPIKISNQKEILLLNVPYKYKEEAKQEGAKYCYTHNYWYIHKDNPNANALIEKYSDKNLKIYLKIPFASKDFAKSKGALWDANKQTWYIYKDNPNKHLLMICSGYVF